LTDLKRCANILTVLENLNADSSVESETRPRDRRAVRRAATRAEIIDAAWALVREHGLAALSLRDLAAKVGMRAPSLYQYFDSKHAIYDAMFAQGMQEALAAMDAVTDEGRMRAALHDAAHRFFQFATSDPARAQLLFQRTIPGFEPSPESYAPALELSARMQEVLNRYGITDPDAMDLWTALIGGLINQQLANDPGGTRWARLVDRTVDMFIADTTPPARPKQKGTR
jgi:AcrR family transcriptional regulator